jgi:hypothetical protein
MFINQDRLVALEYIFYDKEGNYKEMEKGDDNRLRLKEDTGASELLKVN